MLNILLVTFGFFHEMPTMEKAYAFYFLKDFLNQNFLRSYN